MHIGQRAPPPDPRPPPPRLPSASAREKCRYTTGYRPVTRPTRAQSSAAHSAPIDSVITDDTIIKNKGPSVSLLFDLAAQRCQGFRCQHAVTD